MIAGTRFSARVLIFSAISGFVLTNSNLLSAEEKSAQVSSNKHQSTETVRNPQNTLLDAIQREMHSARRITKPRVLFPEKEKKPSQIQQVGLTLNPKAFFQKQSKPSEQKQPEQTRPVIVRGGNQSAIPQYKAAVPQPNANPGQSEIQRQLEALYRRDGRTMPPMDLNALPKTANNNSGIGGRGAVNPAPAPQSPATPQSIVGTPQHSPYQQPDEKKKWYDMFLPSKTKPTPKRLQQSHQVVKKAPVDPPVTENSAAPALPELPAAPAPVTQPFIAGPQQPTDTEESVAKTAQPSAEELEEEEREERAEEEAERLEEQKIAAAKAAANEAKETFVAPVMIEEKTTEVTQENLVKNPDDDFNNLFPEMSEEQADGLKKTAVEPVAPKTPFSGLVLEEESLKNAEEKTAAKSAEPVKEPTPQLAQETPEKEVNPFEPQPEPQATPAKEVNPFEVPVEKIVEKEVEKPKENPFKPQPDQKLEIPPAQPAKQVASNEQDSSIEKKLALIASRGNIKGLKGFCPVALRDNRLLVDARPEFSSSFKSMNYQFASLENKLKFDREPAKYAPAAGGSDIVLLVDRQDDKEGTLDFASWYKGRLYLFSNQANMDAFMKTPALYVGVE
ncbi:MAG: hypothetical protein ABIK07_11910 [Planctomycetota bacterium]